MLKVFDISYNMKTLHSIINPLTCFFTAIVTVTYKSNNEGHTCSVRSWGYML